jgi:YegS/Rv2252/BmrU family lipid kinase
MLRRSRVFGAVPLSTAVNQFPETADRQKWVKHSEMDSTIETPAGAAAPTEQKCVTVIFNPVSGKSDPEARKARISEALAEHGYRCQFLVTTPEKSGQFLAKQALDNHVDLVAVSGGDGTVIEAMSALAGSGVPIAVLPAGTGNLLSVNLKLPKEVPEAVHAALFGEKRPLDLARIRTSDETDGADPRYFAITAGAGYDAWVIHDADRTAKNRFGMFAYLFAAIKNLRRRPTKVDIYIDGSTTPIRRRAKSVMVANMGKLQGSVDFVPDAKPDDGILEVAVLKAETLRDWMQLAFDTVRGRLREDTLIDYFPIRKVEIKLSSPQPMQFDGEMEENKYRSFSVEVVPRAIEVMAPQGSLPETPPQHDATAGP